MILGQQFKYGQHTPPAAPESPPPHSSLPTRTFLLGDPQGVLDALLGLGAPMLVGRGLGLGSEDRGPRLRVRLRMRRLILVLGLWGLMGRIRGWG